MDGVGLKSINTHEQVAGVERKRRGARVDTRRVKQVSVLDYARMKNALPPSSVERVLLRSYDLTTRKTLTAILYHFFREGRSLGPGKGAIPLPKFFFNHRAFFWSQTSLCFSHCHLGSVHRLTMLTFKHITDLDLSHNNFRDIPQGLRENPKRKPGSTLPLLENLDLSHNQIRSISSFAGSMVGLRVLNLSHNEMRRCPRALIERVATLCKLDVDFNPFINPDAVINAIALGNPEVEIVVVDTAEENASQ